MLRIEPADAAFSLCVRERASWVCQRCGWPCPKDGDGRRLDCSHYCGRRSNATRYDPDNGFAHCHECHEFLGGHKSAFDRWVADRVGEPKALAIRQKAQTVLKLNDVDRVQIAAHYRREYRGMLRRRRDGFVGYLPFKAWDDTSLSGTG